MAASSRINLLNIGTTSIGMKSVRLNSMSDRDEANAFASLGRGQRVRDSRNSRAPPNRSRPCSRAEIAGANDFSLRSGCRPRKGIDQLPKALRHFTRFPGVEKLNEGSASMEALAQRDLRFFGLEISVQV